MFYYVCGMLEEVYGGIRSVQEVFLHRFSDREEAEEMVAYLRDEEGEDVYLRAVARWMPCDYEAY